MWYWADPQHELCRCQLSVLCNIQSQLQQKDRNRVKCFHSLYPIKNRLNSLDLRLSLPKLNALDLINSNEVLLAVEPSMKISNPNEVHLFSLANKKQS